MSSLEISKLSFAYRRGFKLRIPALRFDTGVTCLLGPNGAGKSTLIRMITTSALSPSGVIRFEERDVRQHLREYRRALGYLPQRVGFVNNYRVREMLEYVAWMKGVGRRERREAVEVAAEKCDVARFLAHRVGELSGGTLRRVGIAQAIVNTPRYLILDEPTAGLDMVQQSQLHELVRTISQGATVLVSTHASSDVSEMSNRVAVLNSGALLFSGDVAELSAPDVLSPRESLEMGYRRLVEKNSHGTH